VRTRFPRRKQDTDSVGAEKEEECSAGGGQKSICESAEGGSHAGTKTVHPVWRDSASQMESQVLFQEVLQATLGFAQEASPQGERVEGALLRPLSPSPAASGREELLCQRDILLVALPKREKEGEEKTSSRQHLAHEKGDRGAQGVHHVWRTGGASKEISLLFGVWKKALLPLAGHQRKRGTKEAARIISTGEERLSTLRQRDCHIF
jgi:hypothetical protein